MLTIKNLRKRYGNFQALDGLNLEVADGELFGFVGPNGAGKTTTLKILAGLLVPDEGEVEIGGLDVYSDGKELRRRIGYVPDFFGVYDNLKVSEYMEFFASCYGITGLQARTRCHTLLEQVRLDARSGELAPAARASGGRPTANSKVRSMPRRFRLPKRATM